MVGILIPQFAITQVGAPRIEVKPLAVTVKKATRRILTQPEPRRDLAGIAGRITPSWVKKAPASYADENESYLADLQVSSTSQALFDRRDILSRQQELEIQQQYADMSRDFELRAAYGLTDPESTRLQYDRMRDFSRGIFGQVRKYQSDIYRGKLNRAADRDENLRSAPVKVVGSISAIYFDSPVMVALSDETQIMAHTSIPDQTGAVRVTSPVVNGSFEMDGRAEEGLIPGTVPTDPTFKREKYRLSITRPLGILDMTSGVSYGTTTTQMSASLSKPITDDVTCVIDSVRPLNAPGAISEERVKFLYGIRF